MERVRSWIWAAAVVMLAGCGGGGSSSTPIPPAPPPPPPPPPTSTAQLDATVIDTFGRALATASITTGTASVDTDAAGRARISVPTGSERVLKIAKDGFAEQFKVVSLAANATTAQLEAMLIARENAQAIAAIETGGSATGRHGDDLVVLLATLRYRLEPRLQSAGLTLKWEVGDVPKLEWLNATSALQIMRILQEVLTNVLKHAQARTIHIATQVSASSVTVIAADDGVGFDMQRSHSTTLAWSMVRLARVDDFYMRTNELPALRRSPTTSLR